MDDRLVGAASIAPTLLLPNWFSLFAVAVSGEFRRCGLSRPLVTECLAYAGSKNAEGVTLDVNVPNPVAALTHD
jgi:ribosomal protein S18 acetylase RimI-like enzyme